MGRMGILREAKVWRRERPANLTRRSSDLTPDEQANVRKALRFLAVRLGSWPALGKAMRSNASTLWSVAHKQPVSAGIALRAARVAEVAVEEVLGGRWPVEGMCPRCGRYS